MCRVSLQYIVVDAKKLGVIEGIGARNGGGIGMGYWGYNKSEPNIYFHLPC